MGLMPLVFPHLKDAKDEFDKLKLELDRVRSVAEKKTPILLVEGETDVLVFRKAIEVFSKVAVPIHVHNGFDGEYGSAAAVTSRAIAWAVEMRHRAPAERVRALALYDGDVAGSGGKKRLQDDLKKLDIKEHPYLKIMKLPLPVWMRKLKDDGFDVPVTLESFYSSKIWKHAQSQGWLSEVEDVSSRMSKDQINVMVAGGVSPFSELSDIEDLRVRNEFDAKGKGKVARYICRLDDEEARKALAELKSVIGKICVGLVDRDLTEA